MQCKIKGYQELSILLQRRLNRYSGGVCFLPCKWCRTGPKPGLWEIRVSLKLTAGLERTSSSKYWFFLSEFLPMFWVREEKIATQCAILFPLLSRPCWCETTSLRNTVRLWVTTLLSRQLFQAIASLHHVAKQVHRCLVHIPPTLSIPDSSTASRIFDWPEGPVHNCHMCDDVTPNPLADTWHLTMPGFSSSSFAAIARFISKDKWVRMLCSATFVPHYLIWQRSKRANVAFLLQEIFWCLTASREIKPKSKQMPF